MDRCDDSHLLTLLPFQRNGLTWGVHGMGAQLCNLCNLCNLCSYLHSAFMYFTITWHFFSKEMSESTHQAL